MHTFDPTGKKHRARVRNAHLFAFGVVVVVVVVVYAGLVMVNTMK